MSSSGTFNKARSRREKRDWTADPEGPWLKANLSWLFACQDNASGLLTEKNRSKRG